MIFYGLDWILFGMSIVIGLNNVSDVWLILLIKSIEMDMINMKFDVEFIYGDCVFFYIDVMYFEMIFIVKYNLVMYDRKLYFLMIFFFMWIFDGNSLVDCIFVNNDVDWNIIGDWIILYGLFVVFYWKCIFSYNILSFDLKLEIIDKENIVYIF